MMVRRAAKRCAVKNPAISIALNRGEKLGLRRRQRVRSVTVTPKNPLMSNKVAVILSNASSLLSCPKSQCHHNSNTPPMASEIWILRQIFGVIDREVLGSCDEYRCDES